MIISRNIGISVEREVYRDRAIISLCSQRIAYLCGRTVSIQNWYDEENDDESMLDFDFSNVKQRFQRLSRVGHLSSQHVQALFSNTCGTWLAVVCTSSNNNQPTRHQIVEKDHHRYIVQFVNTNDLKVSYSLSLEFKANHIINNLQIPVISISNSSMHASFHINRRKEQSVLVSACYLCKAITEEVARKSSFNIYDARKNSSSKTNIIRESIPQLTLELYCLQKRNEINNELASELEDEIQSDVSDCDYPYQQYKATHLASLNVKSIGNQAKALIKENEKEDIELIQSEITYNKAYLDKYGNLANPIRSARISILTNFALYVCRISESETSGSRHVLPGNDGRYRSRDDLISTVRMPSNGTNQDQPECILSYQTLFSIDSIYSHHCWITLENSNLYLIEINKAGRIEVYRDDISINQMILESRHWLENGCAKRLCLSDKDKRVVCLQAMGNIIFVCTEQNLYTFHLDCTKTSEMYGSTVDCISLRRITLRNLFVDRIQNNLKILIILPQKIKTMLKDQYYLLLLTSNFDLFSLKFDLLFLKNEHNDDRTVSSYHHHLHTSSQQPQFALSKVSEFIKGDIVGFDVSLVKSLVIISTMNGNRLQFYSGTSYFDLLFIIYQQRQTITVKFVSVDTFGSTLLILYNNGRSLVLYGIRASTIGELLFQTELPEQASKAKLCSVGKRIALALSKDGVRSFEPILHRTGRNRESMLSEYECVDIDWFLDGCHLAIACKNGTCLIWNSIKGYIVFTHVEHSTPYCSLKIDHSADIRLYISCLQSKSVIQLDRYEKRNLNETFTNEKVLKSTRLSQLPGGEPTCICVEHKILAIGGQNGTISLYTLPFSEVYNNICKQTAFAYFDAFSTEIIYLAMNHFEIVACDGNGCLIGLKIPHTTYYTGSGAQRLTEPLSAWSEVAQIDSKTISECQRAIEVGSQAADLTSRNVQSAFEISKQETIHSGEKRCEIVVDRIIESDKQSNLVLTNARTLVNHNQRSIEFLSNMYREIVNFYQQALVERIAVYREQMQSLTRSDSKMSHSGSSIKSLTEQLSQSTVNLLGQQTRETMILQRNLANLANSLLMQTEVCEKAKQLVKDFVNDRLYRCNQFVNFKLRAQQRKIKLMEEKLNDKTQQLTDLKEELESSKSRCRKLATRFGREMEKIAGKQAVK
ncbi:hypothetical protein GJ496_007228 [Pomphorhynchus laevis]|nr:hypothetical protein GJ496_007228 [Pomphorhynchus laevis]